MHSAFGHALLVIGVLLSSAIGPGHAMTTIGEIDPGTAPPWIAVTEPYQMPLPPLESALLPPQFERVLMLDIDGRSDNSADAVIDTLFAKSPAVEDIGPVRPATSALHPRHLAAFAMLLLLGGYAAHRLRRRRRLARIARIANGS